ncbi:prepilin-type N-terminal cleavage/methylation domain-containing protein [Methylocella tundrae]|uniref:Type II secretion system protein GspH n=1 Tax=Methylocella tundrae TaxID=227605 RepID=A0A4U8YXK7_METTU|nr:prepilin-type N-terminal cleavage/methylation domain-containing protein [Methylocella tundrae]WPP05715.1 prepilin-type N-terminal cleavage/methylation domain-containing protein [Methylocella tundrae]VFU08201.1 Type II secretion system protein GspH [Methylocella tundrae]
MKERWDESGFTLLEIVCVLAIIAMLAAIALPAFPHGTSRSRLEALAVATAAVLKSDRNAALRRGAPVSTEINTVARTVRSGAGGGSVRVPGDVAFSAILADSCDQHDAGTSISFFGSGLSCGGTLSLSRLGATFEIRVAWLTGGVEIVQKKTF